MCILGSDFVRFLLVCITPSATQQAGGSRQESVGSLNPVNVEQHLIRSALRSSSCNLCMSLNTDVNAAVALNEPVKEMGSLSASVKKNI